MTRDSAAGFELANLTEAQLSEMLAGEGQTVAVHAGRHWTAIFPGFYQPVNLLARLRAGEVDRPVRACWGYRAGLDDSAGSLATGSIPVHLYADVARFDRRTLANDRRHDLRRCDRDVTIWQPSDATAFVEEGYRVFRSAQDRVHYWADSTEERFRERIRERIMDPRRFIIGGRVDGRLAGYLESHAVDGVLYTGDLIVATEALDTGIATGLFVTVLEVAANHSAIRDVCLGLDTPERPGLTSFKSGLRVPVVHIPARTVMPPPIAAYIRARRPAAYYRLTGVRSGAA